MRDVLPGLPYHHMNSNKDASNAFVIFRLPTFWRMGIRLAQLKLFIKPCFLNLVMFVIPLDVSYQFLPLGSALEFFFLLFCVVLLFRPSLLIFILQPLRLQLLRLQLMIKVVFLSNVLPSLRVVVVFPAVMMMCLLWGAKMEKDRFHLSLVFGPVVSAIGIIIVRPFLPNYLWPRLLHVCSHVE